MGQLICVVGFSKDKDIDAILASLPRNARYIFTQASSSRAADAAMLAQKAQALGLKGEVVESVAEAVARAKTLATEEDAIFVGGSNFVVAEVL